VRGEIPRAPPQFPEEVVVVNAVNAVHVLRELERMAPRGGVRMVAYLQGDRFLFGVSRTRRGRLRYWVPAPGSAVLRPSRSPAVVLRILRRMPEGELASVLEEVVYPYIVRA
jgi:hypothetical protein